MCLCVHLHTCVPCIFGRVLPHSILGGGAQITGMWGVRMEVCFLVISVMLPKSRLFSVAWEYPQVSGSSSFVLLKPGVCEDTHWASCLSGGESPERVLTLWEHQQPSPTPENGFQDGQSVWHSSPCYRRRHWKKYQNIKTCFTLSFASCCLPIWRASSTLDGELPGEVG